MFRDALIFIAAGVWGLMAVPSVAQEIQRKMFLEMSCLESDEKAALYKDTRSLLVMVTEDEHYIYQLRVFDGWWVLVAQDATGATCVIAQSSNVHFSPSLQQYLPPSPPAKQ